MREDASLDSRWVGGYALARWTMPARRDSWRRRARRPLGRHGRDDGVAVGQRAGARRARSTCRRARDSFGSSPGSTRLPACVARRGCRPSAPGTRMSASAAGSARTCARRPSGSIATSSDGLRLPGDEWQLVDGRPTSAACRHGLRRAPRRHGARAWSCCSSGAARTGCRAGRATRLGRYRQHDVVTGERFDGDFDQRHAVSLYGVYRLNDRTSVAMKLRASSNFPGARLLPGTAGLARAPRARRPAGAVRVCPRRATARGCPSTSASTCAPTARGRCSAAG